MSFALRLPAGPRKNVAAASEANPRPGAREPVVVSPQCGYELWAPSYDHEPNPILTLEARLLTPMLGNLKGSRVLDLACGTGRWLSILLRLGASAGIGIDCSQSMLTAAESKPMLRGRLARADCLALPLPSASVDLVTCSFALGHVREVGMLAAELARVVRPNAAIYLSEVHPAAYQMGFLRTRFRSNGGTVEIATFSRPMEQLFDVFAAQGLAVAEFIEGRLGNEERPVFERAGRLERFHELAGVPAIFIVRFHRERCKL